MSRYHHGDTIHIKLEYTVNGVPLKDADVDEIEMTIGGKQYTLTGGDIELVNGEYELFLDQQDTFALNDNADYQPRILKDGEVGSLDIKGFGVGETISTKVLGEQENGA